MTAGHEIVLISIGHRQTVGHERVVAAGLLQHLAVLRRGPIVRQQGHRGRIWGVRRVIHSQQIAPVRPETRTVPAGQLRDTLLLRVHCCR